MSLALPEPDRAVIRQRAAIVADLAKLVPPGTIIDDEEGRRAYETDALTAYRRLPLAVALPASTEEVSRLLRYCYANDIKVVARGAGTSLSGGALPGEDTLGIGVSRMHRVLDVDTLNRTARVETGITNLGISDAVKAHGFFYAPDPSSQLACTLAGNLGMNSGGAHCLKYGVTTNNVLGLRFVLMDGEVVDIGGAHLDAAGYDLMGLIIGSEGQFGLATEATVRILRSPEGARPMLLGFGSSQAAGNCVSAIIAAGIIPVAIEFMDKPAIQVCEAFAKAGTAVLGVSGDPVAAQDAFKAVHKLKIPLASDETHRMLAAYGAWGKKSMYGKTFMGIKRTTFLIDASGKIARIWNNVKVDGHAEEVLAAAKAL